jgi:hypothetical protein
MAGVCDETTACHCQLALFKLHSAAKFSTRSTCFLRPGYRCCGKFHGVSKVGRRMFVSCLAWARVSFFVPFLCLIIVAYFPIGYGMLTLTLAL